MSLILNIDTSVESGSICLSKDEGLLLSKSNHNKNDHASWIHTAINEITRESGYDLNKLQAVAVSAGPGSYTGLRIGLSAAKGLCYALKIPLITVNTLQIMAVAVLNRDKKGALKKNDLLCPLIDARRMEAYFAVFDTHLSMIITPSSMVIEKKSFDHLLNNKMIAFFGNGADKLKSILINPNAVFIEFDMNNLANEMFLLSYRQWLKKQFADIAWSEPLYIKEFYSPGRKNK